MPIKMLEVPVAEIVTKMTQVSTEDMGRKYCDEMDGLRIRLHESLPYSETLLGKLDTLKRNAGICIECVKSIGAAEL